MTGTFPKNAGFTFFSGSQKARPLCGNPRRSFHFFGPSGFPLASQAVRGVSQDPRNLSGIARKLEENSGSRVYRLPVSHPNQNFPLRPWSPLRNPRSWRVLANAIRRDWSVRNSNRFCRSFHLSRNDGIASKIIARDPFGSDGHPFRVHSPDFPDPGGPARCPRLPIVTAGPDSQ